jgi:hypothetical protein
MNKLTENQIKLIDSITNEFIKSNNQSSNSMGMLIDIPFLLNEKKEWEETIRVLTKQNEYFHEMAIQEGRNAYDRLCAELMGIGFVEKKEDDYGSEIKIAKHKEHLKYHHEYYFRISISAPKSIYKHNKIGDYFKYADSIRVSCYASSCRESIATSVEELLKDRDVARRILEILK